MNSLDYQINPPQDKNKADTVTISFDDGSLQEAKDLAKELNTTVGGVMAQAYELLRMAQGRVVTMKEKGSDTILRVKVFAKNKTRVE
ncbi:MAG: hypothetical protein GF390_02635 [Candidatus Pacebacteria bacterium]|nr:hypothetical protein [Candidatus Paceibacterota bacterium]